MNKLLIPLVFAWLAAGLLLGTVRAQQDAKNHPVSAIFLSYKEEKELKALSKKFPIFLVAGKPAILGELANPRLVTGEPLRVYLASFPKTPKIDKPLAEAPYEFNKDGEREIVGRLKKLVVDVPFQNALFIDNNLQQLQVADSGLLSVCNDLEQRRQRVVDLQDELKALRKSVGTDQYEQVRRSLVHEWENLVQYVEASLLFKAMAPALREEFEKEVKALRSAESSGRIEAFSAAVAGAEVTELETGKGHKMVFQQIESPHIRIQYLTGKEGIDEAQARDLLQLGEETIESFRQIAIDPHKPFRDEQESETPIIPNSIFFEFFVGPDDPVTQQELYEEHYKVSESDPKSFEVSGTGGIRRQERKDPLFFHFVRHQPGSLNGHMVHMLGHNLASLHYNRRDPLYISDALPEVREAVAMTLSFEKLGHNAMKCINDLKGEYEAPEVSDKRLEVEIWDSYRDACFKQSLQAEPFESCCIVPLNNLNPLHLSKGWVMLHYILNSDPIRGQKWLRAAHDSIDKAGTGDRTGINRNLWRDKTKELFAGEEFKGDPLLFYEEKIKELARSELGT
ncbi:MAG: hypothetical protein R3F33_07190 [Planctomycetota bacterium]